ncbi:interleukin-23 subunit alpha isoform X1 [Accipiter gentilis]|uniref:interleukin-23 subunit alpha isoform X1 n=1 Tax=Astur gentilis TaxID=8957 RepID=UPI002110742E|nr:interleukin-23 subunit alpha isoform X1 [Accipiter gentilis]
MASLHRLHLCLCLPPLLLLLLPPAAPAPVTIPGPGPGPRTDWAACKNISRELLQRVATLKEPHQVLEETHLSEEDPKNWPPRIRCSDACDPSTLDTNNTRCLRRILQGLQHYRDLLGSDIFTTRPLPWLEAALDQLLGLVQVSGWGGGRQWQPPRSLFPHCSQGSRRLSAAAAGPLTPLFPQQEHGRLPRHPMAPSEAWAHPLLQRLALQRLQSFATVISRIFTHSASPR